MASFLSFPKKYNELTLDKKVEVIDKIENGASYRTLAKEYKISTGQIVNIMKRKLDIIDSFNSSDPLDKKRILTKKTANAKLNDLIHKYFIEVRSRNLPINGPIIKEKAKLFATELGVENFRGSEGWLNRWKVNHGICFKNNVGTLNINESSSINNQFRIEI